MKYATQTRTYDKPIVLITPVYLVTTKDHKGLLTRDLIEEGNEVKMYYVAIEKLLKMMKKVPKYSNVKMNIVINNYNQFTQENIYTMLRVIKDILLLFTDLKVHFYDERCACESGII